MAVIDMTAFIYARKEGKCRSASPARTGKGTDQASFFSSSVFLPLGVTSISSGSEEACRKLRMARPSPPPDFGQALRAENDQYQHQNNQKFLHAYSKHGNLQKMFRHYTGLAALRSSKDRTLPGRLPMFRSRDFRFAGRSTIPRECAPAARPCW